MTVPDHTPAPQAIIAEIEEFLRLEGGKELLRFSTAGSVDDGKSTMIGRMLCDSKNIYLDQLASVKRVSGQINNELEIDYALFTDGLKAEREQGITIDVAYRYFSTPRRKFIIADTPGHEQYTRNMATGASTANLAIVLIDARKGVLPQSKRHAFIASLLGIPHILVAVNKMDLVDYDEAVFQAIRDDFRRFAAKLMIPDLRFIPVSALHGDNLLTRSERTPWYRGESLMDILESITIVNDRNLVDLRFPVQLVLRPHLDFRGYAGTVASGVIRKGEPVLVLPSMKMTRVKAIHSWEGELEAAFPPLSVTVTLEDEIDISRGDMLVHRHNLPRNERRFEAMVVWMSDTPLDPTRQYLIKHTTRTVKATVDKIMYRVDVNSLTRSNDTQSLRLNEIGRVIFSAAQPLFYDPYTKNRATGSFILIDTISNNTMGAGMMIDREPPEQMTARMDKPAVVDVAMVPRRSRVSAAERSLRLKQKPVTLWLTGLVGAGKTELAFELEARLFAAGAVPVVLDGENMRLGLSRDLDFSEANRTEHLRRVGEVCRMFNDSGLIAIGAFTSPTADGRRGAAEVIGRERFLEIHVSSPLEWCRAHDSSGLYEKAERGELPNFPGVHAPYEVPEHPALVLPLHETGIPAAAERILTFLHEQGIFPFR